MAVADDSIRIALVCSEFNAEITDRMLRSALARSSERAAVVRFICRVPGAFDMPLFIKELVQRDDVDAVVTIGAIVTGETKHDEVIAAQLASSIADISVRCGKPISLGVSGPGMTWDQGLSRAEEYASRSVDAALKMVSSLRQISSKRSEKEYPAVIG